MRNRQRTDKWKPEETEKFYLALSIFGTDFTMIERIFNLERSREQIKVTIITIDMRLDLTNSKRCMVCI
jgi:transcription factor TFIIIB component B''